MSNHDNFYRVRRLEIAQPLIEAEKLMRRSADGWFGVNDAGAARLQMMADQTSIMVEELLKLGPL